MPHTDVTLIRQAYDQKQKIFLFYHNNATTVNLETICSNSLDPDKKKLAMM